MHRCIVTVLRCFEWCSFRTVALKSKAGSANRRKRSGYFYRVRITYPTLIDNGISFEISGFNVWKEPVKISKKKTGRRSIQCETRTIDDSRRETPWQYCCALLFAYLWVSDTVNRIWRFRELFVVGFPSSSIPIQNALSCPFCTRLSSHGQS